MFSYTVCVETVVLSLIEKSLASGHDTNRITDVTTRFFPSSWVFDTFILTNAITDFHMCLIMMRSLVGCTGNGRYLASMNCK